MHINPELTSELLARCERLGLGAIVLDGAGRAAGSTPQGARLDQLIRAWPFLSAGSGTEAAECEAWPGCRVLTLTLQTGGAWCGRLLVLALAQGSLDHPALAEACRAAGVDRRVVREQLKALARADHPSSAWLRRVLSQQAADATAIFEQNESMAGFGARLGESFDTIDVLYTIGRSMRGPFQPTAFLNLVCSRLQGALPLGWVSAVFDRTNATARGLRGLFVLAGSAPIQHDAFEAACRGLIEGQGEPATLIDDRRDLSPETGQVMRMPIMCKGRIAGAVLAGNKTGADGMLTSYEMQLVEAAAGHLSAFADNVALYEDQHDLFIGTLQALTASIDAKDRYTRGHSERVAWVAQQLSIALGLPAADSERLRIAGLVHDVGKIGVPERVLTKSGKLTEDEYAQIKRHPTIGHQILKDIPQLADVLPAVLHHHERYDGRGYPHGLAAARIPLYARIIAVADTFDAMSSTRSYRPALPRDKVLSEMVRVAGTQLDPELAPLIQRIDLAEFDRMVARHAESDIGMAA